MYKWVIEGINTGIKSSGYPAKREYASGITQGMFSSNDEISEPLAMALIESCPMRVFSISGGKLSIDMRRCVHCYRCVLNIDSPVDWKDTFQWAYALEGKNPLPSAFESSAHICVMDTGGCGACLNEIRQLNNPYYNMHRLGFFITPTPRHADILLVVGSGTEHLKFALKRTYEAMPEPKRVVAVGSCALCGGIFEDSFNCGKGVEKAVPVDVRVPGCPAPPLAILHGLLVAAGRKPPVSLPLAFIKKTEVKG